MGCSVSSKKSLPMLEEGEEPSVIRSVADIKIQPQQFILESSFRFNEVYRLGQRIGIGSISEVRVCYHRETGVKRAVKIFRKDQMTNEGLRSRLHQEIQVLKQLDHPSIIRILEYFEEIQKTYIVMEHVKNGQLFSELALRDVYSEHEASLIMQQLFSAVGYLHSSNVVHRDIKPENIMLEDSKNLQIKLINFVNSAMLESREVFSSVRGTAVFMAPEMLAKGYTSKCDMWSCGVVLYLLLSGRTPFADNDTSNLSFDDAPWPSLSSEVKDLLSRILVPEKSRLTAQQALIHPWIVQDLRSSLNELKPIAANKLRLFHVHGILRDAVQTYLTVQQIGSEESKALTDAFKSMDSNCDGKLSREELYTAYSSILGEAEAEETVNTIIDNVDSDKNGYVNYSEFLKATLDFQNMMSIKHIKCAFELFDRDFSGGITASELKEVLGGEAQSEDSVWDQLIKELDVNGDGEVDFEEFSNMLKKLFS